MKSRELALWIMEEGVSNSKTPSVKRVYETVYWYLKSGMMDVGGISQEVANYHMGQTRLQRLGSVLGIVKVPPKIRGFQKRLSEIIAG